MLMVARCDAANRESCEGRGNKGAAKPQKVQVTPCLTEVGAKRQALCALKELHCSVYSAISEVQLAPVTHPKQLSTHPCTHPSLRLCASARFDAR